MIWTHTAAGIAGAVIAGALAWQTQAWRYDAQLSKLHAQHASESAKAETATRARRKPHSTNDYRTPTMPQPNAKRNCALMLLLPAALLTACAAPSTNFVQASPTLPQAPSLREPIPQQSYSERASANIEQWQSRLTDMLGTR